MNRYAYVGNNPVNMWDPTGQVPDWVMNKQSHQEIEDYEDEEIHYVFTVTWTFNSYSSALYEPLRISEDRQERQIVKQWEQAFTEEWNYTHSWSKYYYGLSVFTGSDPVTYSENGINPWSVTITAEQIAVQSAAVIRGHGEPPANAKPILKFSSIKGEQTTSEVLISQDQFASFSSVQQQIVAESIYSFTGNAINRKPSETKPVLVAMQCMMDSVCGFGSSNQPKDHNEKYKDNPFVYQQLQFLGTAWHAAGPDANGENRNKEMQDQIHATAEFLRYMVASGQNYAIVSIDTFLPRESGTAPLGQGTYLGNGDERPWEVNSLNVKTLQYAVVNLDYNSLVGFSYNSITERVDNDDHSKVIQTKREDIDRMRWIQLDLDPDGGSNLTQLMVVTRSGNPIPGYGIIEAPPIDYTISLEINRKEEVTVTAITDKFPSYEGYISINGENFNKLFRLPAIGGFNNLAVEREDYKNTFTYIP
jgi:hypothetical protein